MRNWCNQNSNYAIWIYKFFFSILKNGLEVWLWRTSKQSQAPVAVVLPGWSRLKIVQRPSANNNFENVVQVQKETVNIQVWCSNIGIGNLKFVCFLMTIGYYTWRKNIRKQLAFKLATSIKTDLNVVLYSFFVNATMSFSTLNLSTVYVAMSIEFCYMSSDISVFIKTAFLSAIFNTTFQY